MVCVESPSYSIIINRGPNGYFRGKKGIRQGDPMWPYQFVHVMDLSTHVMKKSVRDGRFKLHYKCEDLEITHLF